MKTTALEGRMNYTGSLAMGDCLLSTAMGLIGDCRQLAHIAVGNRRQPLLSRLWFPPRNNALSTPQKFFPLQITAERWKIFFRGGKAFSTFRRLQRSDQPQENFPLSSFLEICEVPNLSMKSNSAAQKLSVTQRQR
jgi:hypothetical protein